jgi:hypothetical protein
MIADETRAYRGGDYGTRKRAALCSHQVESHTSLRAAPTQKDERFSAASLKGLRAVRPPYRRKDL